MCVQRNVIVQIRTHSEYTQLLVFFSRCPHATRTLTGTYRRVPTDTFTHTVVKAFFLKYQCASVGECCFIYFFFIISRATLANDLVSIRSLHELTGRYECRVVETVQMRHIYNIFCVFVCVHSVYIFMIFSKSVLNFSGARIIYLYLIFLFLSEALK